MAARSSLLGEALEKAKNELGEVPERREEEIKKLREAIEAWRPAEGQEAVNFTRKDDDSFLLMFLRARKFNTERALQLYVNYHQYRSKHSEVLGDLTDIQSVQHVLQSGVICVLDQCSKTGCKVIVFRADLWDLQTITIEEVSKVLVMVLDKLIEEEETQVHGFAIIEDLDGMDFFKMMQLARKERELKNISFELIQDAFPARFKAVHVIHQPWYVSIFMTIMRPFMKQKLRERIHMHGSEYETLFEFMDPAHLPSQFGGQRASLENFSAARLFE